MEKSAITALDDCFCTLEIPIKPGRKTDFRRRLRQLSHRPDDGTQIRRNDNRAPSGAAAERQRGFCQKTEAAEPPAERSGSAVPLTGQFSNLFLEELERLWEVHDYLPNPGKIF